MLAPIHQDVRTRPVPPYWSTFEAEEKEEKPEVLTARPHNQNSGQIIDMRSEQKLQESPTKELMDRHHDSDALTAYKH